MAANFFSRLEHTEPLLQVKARQLEYQLVTLAITIITGRIFAICPTQVILDGMI